MRSSPSLRRAGPVLACMLPAGIGWNDPAPFQIEISPFGPADYEEDRRTTNSTFTFILHTDGDFLGGDERWTWAGPSERCVEGRSDVNGTRE